MEVEIRGLYIGVEERVVVGWESCVFEWLSLLPNRGGWRMY